MTTLARAIELLGDPRGGYALTALDVDGRMTTWGEAAERLTGYPGREVVGSPFSVLWSEPAGTECLRRASELGVFLDEAVLARQPGDLVLAARRIAHVSDVSARIRFLVAMSPAPSLASVPTLGWLTAAILESVVHPVFAAGLELNSLMARLTEPGLRAQVAGSIDHLDVALRNLRRVVAGA